MEAATHACRHPVYRDRYQRNKARLGKQRGAKVAQVDIARPHAEAIWRGAKVAQVDIASPHAEAIWHMLTRDQHFAPAGATASLAA